MTASDIESIVITVGFCQLMIDLLSNYLVYNADPYQRSVRTMERLGGKFDKAEADLKSKGEKHRKKFDRADADYRGSRADVARRHFAPAFLGSVFYLILMRILGTEHKGKVLGVLPFVPYNFLTRVTARGLDWTQLDAESLSRAAPTSLPQQAFSFFFLYALANLSVKYYVKQLMATKPPRAADGGITTVMDSPLGQGVMRSMGLDPEELKMD